MSEALPFINLHTHTLCEKSLNALEYKFILKHQCLIFAFNSKEVCIALKDTSAPIGLIRAHIAKLYPYAKLALFTCLPQAFDVQAKQIQRFQMFHTLKNALLQQHKTPLDSKNAFQDLSAVALLDFILQACIEEGASDIHFECFNEQHIHKARIRVRVDGMLREIFSLESSIFEALSSLLKLECELDINQNRQSQDGRFSREFNALGYDFRLSCLPAFGGESIVLRILHKNAKSIHLEQLGFNPTHLEIIKRNIFTPHGIILLTGPTGSGKSTTLYAILELLKSPLKKIITLEDPIEYQMQLVTQVLVQDKYDFGFTQALRAILRHDPDILSIGEIRDEQSLEIALRASLTGHLVLATLHANDALSVIERLLDMGAQGYLLASSLHLVISQRLARRLCPHCKLPLSAQEVYKHFEQRAITHLWEEVEQGSFFAPNGCGHCHMQGFSGRLLISECLEHSPLVYEYIKSPQNKAYIMQELRQMGFKSMFENGLQMLKNGLSSFDEIYRVCKI